MKNNIKISLLFALGIIFLTVCSPKDVFAVSVSGHCYFQNFSCTIGTEDYGGPDTSWLGNDLFNGRDQSGNGTALPSVNMTKDDLITFINVKASGSSDKERMSAEYIKEKMTNNNPSTWVGRMSSSDIGVKPGITSSTDKTTFFYQGAPSYDILEAGSTTGAGKPVVVIYSISNSTIYAEIEVNCGNMLTNPIPLPLQSWAVAVSTTISSTTATVGDTIIWGHSAEITGTEATNAAVTYSYKNTNGWSGGGTLGTIDSGSPVGTNPSVNSPSYIIQSSDVGKKLCRVTTARPKAKGDSGMITSTEQCVTVTGSQPPVAGTCRPWVLDVDVPTDVHYGTRVPVHITGTDTLTGLTKTWTTTQSTLNVTSDCTNGNTWNFHFVTDTYIYYHATFCTGDYCTPYDHDYTQHNTWDVNAQGPCFDYNLNASIGSLSTYQLEVNSIVDVTPKMTSDSWTQLNLGSFFATYGTHTKSKTTDWQVLQLIVDPNIPVPSISNPDPGAGNPGTATPCAYYQSLSGISGCSVLKSGSTVFSNNTNSTVMSGDNPFSTLSVTIPDQTGGTRVCFAFAAHPAASDPSYGSFSADPQWDYSAINGVRPETPCIIVVKKPKVQVWGGDLLARSNVTTTTSVKNMGTPRTYGSWAEYSLFVNGTVSGMASGSAFAGQGSVSNAVCSYSVLTFANVYGNAAACTGTAGTIGHYTNARSMLDVAASFPGVGTVISGTVVPSSLGSGIYTANSDIILNASNLPISKSVIIKAIGHTVRISGNQTYSNGPYGVISDLPQLVIIADSIIIDSNVTTIDSWLVANSGTGFISTCNGYDNQNLTVNDCSLPLIVNGPVIAKRLSLRRTAGSGVDVTSSNPNDVFSYLNGNRSATSGDPSEVFNLRADAYLWSFAHATSSGRAQTVYTTELPPRF